MSLMPFARTVLHNLVRKAGYPELSCADQISLCFHPGSDCYQDRCLYFLWSMYEKMPPHMPSRPIVRAITGRLTVCAVFNAVPVSEFVRRNVCLCSRSIQNLRSVRLWISFMWIICRPPPVKTVKPAGSANPVKPAAPDSQINPVKPADPADSDISAQNGHA